MCLKPMLDPAGPCSESTELLQRLLVSGERSCGGNAAYERKRWLALYLQTVLNTFHSLTAQS